MRIREDHRPGTARAPARHVVAPLYTPRLRLRSRAAGERYLDGAWWPRGADLAVELPDLLAVLTVRLGPIWRVVYDPSCWSAAPASTMIGARSVRLDPYHFEVWNTLYVFGRGAGMLVLQVIPADTDAEVAHTALMEAGEQDPPDAEQVMPITHYAAMGTAPMLREERQPFGRPTRTPRLLLRPGPNHTEQYDGAWWPRTANLTAELHDLIYAVTPRLGPTVRISFDWNATSRRQRSIDHDDGVSLQIPDIGQLPDTMHVVGVDGTQLTLLVIAADTPQDLADAQLLNAVGRTSHHLSGGD